MVVTGGEHTSYHKGRFRFQSYRRRTCTDRYRESAYKRYKSSSRDVSRRHRTKFALPSLDVNTKIHKILNLHSSGYREKPCASLLGNQYHRLRMVEISREHFVRNEGCADTFLRKLLPVRDKI